MKSETSWYYSVLEIQHGGRLLAMHIIEPEVGRLCKWLARRLRPGRAHGGAASKAKAAACKSGEGGGGPRANTRVGPETDQHVDVHTIDVTHSLEINVSFTTSENIANKWNKPAQSALILLISPRY